MNLTHPDARRALRSIVQAVVALVLVVLVAWLIHLLRSHAPSLERIALALIGIVFTGTLLYGAENVTRAVKFKAGATGFEGSIGEEEAAQTVADAAQDRADEVKQ